MDIRHKALKEAEVHLGVFVRRIRQSAVEQDRILRGNGHTFLEERDNGRWEGATVKDVDGRINSLSEIYFRPTNITQAELMALNNMMKDKVTLVKKDGTVVRENFKALVTQDQITTFVTDIPIEVEDHLLRTLPNGLVEDFIVIAPNYNQGLVSIKPHYIVKVKRSDAPAAPPQTIIANVSGTNAKVNINSVDNSINSVGGISGGELAAFVKEISVAQALMDEPQIEAIAAPLEILKIESESSSPEQGKVHGALKSIRTVFEGATGSLIASGIVATIAKLLAG